MKVKHSELKSILFNLTQNREYPSPLFISGGMGIGKSQLVLQHSQSMAENLKRKFIQWNKLNSKDKLDVINNPQEYYCFVDIRLSQKDPTDIYGIPNISQGVSFLEYIPHDWAKYFIQEQSAGCLFLDEINQAPPLVTGAAFQLIHDRECGGKKFSNMIQIVAAGNREEDHANIYEMSYPLRDRFREVELTVNVDEFSKWAYENNINPSLVAFVNFNPSYLYRVPDDGGKPATPRSIASASTDMNGVAGAGKTSETFMSVAMNVGEAWALQFDSFCECKEQLNLDKIFKQPSLIKDFDNAKIYALLGALTEYYIKEKNQERFDNCLNVLVEMHDDQVAIGLRIMNGNDIPSYKKFWDGAKKKHSKILEKIVKTTAKYQV